MAAIYGRNSQTGISPARPCRLGNGRAEAAEWTHHIFRPTAGQAPDSLGSPPPTLWIPPCSLSHKRPDTQTRSGRLHLASPVSFACARARAGRRAAGMTQLRLSTLEPQIKSCGPTCHHHNQQEIFFFFSPALLASRPFPHAHAAPCPEQADRCDIADLVSGQSSRIRRPCAGSPHVGWGIVKHRQG